MSNGGKVFFYVFFKRNIQSTFAIVDSLVGLNFDSLLQPDLNKSWTKLKIFLKIKNILFHKYFTKYIKYIRVLNICLVWV